jgi:predicted amidophosphoribosyltransferase
MSEECIECGKKLKPLEKVEGFCFNCQVKINNDFRILDEVFQEKAVFSENIFE